MASAAGTVGAAIADGGDGQTETKAPEIIRLNAHVDGVPDEVFSIACGNGPQTIKWLGHVAIARTDKENCKGWLTLGVPTKVTRQNGEELPLASKVCEVLKNGDHVNVFHSLGASGASGAGGASGTA